MNDKDKPQNTTSENDKPVDGGSTYVTLNDQKANDKNTNKQ